jgi:hypothetical protein
MTGLARNQPIRTGIFGIKGLQIITSENETLPYDEKLGAWIDEPHKHWEWSYSPLLRTLYQSNNELWYAHFLDDVNYM